MAEKDSRDLLLFDLGGVLVEYTGLSDIRSLLSRPLTDEELRQLVAATSECWASFECGALTPEAFAEGFAAVWPLALGREAFLAEFETWTRRLLPGAEALLARLRRRYRLAALSNSNALHWRRTCQVLGVDSLFERAFASHELGVRKPAREAYELVLRELSAPAGRTTFFDDVEENVEAARAVGMRAYRVRGVDELQRCLRELGMLDASGA